MLHSVCVHSVFVSSTECKTSLNCPVCRALMSFKQIQSFIEGNSPSFQKHEIAMHEGTLEIEEDNEEGGTQEELKEIIAGIQAYQQKLRNKV